VSNLKRVRDWRVRLSDAIEARRRIPFSEENNCGVFLFDCIAAMTGVDIFKPYRGQYKTIVEGIALLRRAGYADLCAFLAEHLEEIHPSQARSGDLMAFPSERTGWSGGVVNGERVTVLALEGLATVSRDIAARAFRVP
jgi:hypothetical protein